MSESPAKGSLPYGWQVKTSKKYPDRVYYFNVFTGSSTWECPELDPPNEVLKEVKRQKISPKAGSQLLQLKEDLIKDKIKSKQEYSDKRKLHILSGSSDVSSKVSSVPTAVVVPVIHKQDKFNVSVKPKLSQLKDLEVRAVNSQKLKRKIDHVNDTAAVIQNIGPVVKKKRRNRKRHKKNHSLTISDDKKETSKVRTGDLKGQIDHLNVTAAIVQNTDIIVKKKKNRRRIKNKKKQFVNISDDQKGALKEVLKYEQQTNNSQKLSTNEETPVKCSSESLSSEKKDVEDIEMLDVSMEMIDDLTAKKETVFVTVASYYIVVDTNVLISQLNLVNELKDTPMNGCGPPHIFIPWIVIEELDRLKSNRGNKGIMRAVSEAIRYLNSVLSKHPRFHGQSPMEAEEWAKTYSKCNDDKILECCTALSDRMPKEKVILLTYDKNLVNKALILNINVHNWTSMMKSVKPDTTFNFSENTDKRSRKRSKKFEGSSNVLTKEAATISQDKQMLEELDAYKREIHTIMCTARQLLKNNLSKFLDVEMHEAYGTNWLAFPIQRNLLDGMLAAILKYWRMVFSTFMTEKDKRNFELLHTKVCRPEGFLADDKEECLVILSSIEDVFLAIKRRKPSINVPVERIQEFRVAIVESFYSYNELDGTIKQAEQESALALFEKDWDAINQLCGIVLDSCGLQHDFEYNKPSELFTDTQVRQLMCDFYPALKMLKTLMFAMHNAVQECRPTKAISKKLSQSLLDFIPTMKLQYQSFTIPHFSPRALEMFCTNPQNRKMIEIGCKQIERYFAKIDEVLVALMSSTNQRICKGPEAMICD